MNKTNSWVVYIPLGIANTKKWQLCWSEYTVDINFIFFLKVPQRWVPEHRLEPKNYSGNF